MRELQAQLQETQDDLESEKEGRAKAEKQKRQVNDVSTIAPPTRTEDITCSSWSTCTTYLDYCA